MTPGQGSADKILAILDLFTEERLEWTPDELMARLGYSRPTLYRYLKTLKSVGFLTSLPGAGFTLGPRVTELDFLMRKSDPLLAAGRPAVADLAARFPCAALLVRWYGAKLLCVDSVISDEAPLSSYPRGRPMPLAHGAISRAILANLPKRRQVPLIEENLARFKELGHGATVDEVLGTLRAIRRKGVAVAYGEVTSGVIGVAAPVFDAGRAPIAALCVTNRREDVDPIRLHSITGAVRASAAEITRSLAQFRHVRGADAAVCRDPDRQKQGYQC